MPNVMIIAELHPYSFLALCHFRKKITLPVVLQGMPPGIYIEPELPPELLQQGWRKFWSKRGNRPYFWNKLTGESLWEMPQLKPQVSAL